MYFYCLLKCHGQENFCCSHDAPYLMCLLMNQETILGHLTLKLDSEVVALLLKYAVFKIFGLFHYIKVVI